MSLYKTINLARSGDFQGVPEYERDQTIDPDLLRANGLDASTTSGLGLTALFFTASAKNHEGAPWQVQALVELQDPRRSGGSASYDTIARVGWISLDNSVQTPSEINTVVDTWVRSSEATLWMPGSPVVRIPERVEGEFKAQYSYALVRAEALAR